MKHTQACQIMKNMRLNECTSVKEKRFRKKPDATQQIAVWPQTISWRLWWVYLVFAIVYTVTRLWRMVSRAWTHVQRRINEDRSGKSKEFNRGGQTQTSSSAPANGEPIQQSEKWSWRKNLS